MPLGFRVYTSVDRPDPRLTERFRELPSTDISDVMHKAGTMDTAIAPAFTPASRVVGPAVTVSVPTGGQNLRKMGMEQTREGDVLVINAYGNQSYAMLGANIGRGLFHRGIAGIVIDGVFRDPSEFRELGLPIFSRGLATISGPKEGPGEVNVPIACGNVVVNPGDIIIADEDGIVVVPPRHAESILTGVDQLQSRHEKVQGELRSGQVTGLDQINRELNQEGCEFLSESYSSPTN